MDETQPLYQEAITTFRALLDEATRGGEPEPTAMTLATADTSGRVSARVVLLKGVDERGFVFYTNYESDKAEQLAAHAQVALCFLWRKLRDAGVQVRVEGRVHKTAEAESDVYFASRDRASRIGAWASTQSKTLPSRETFYERIAVMEKKFEGVDVPRPPHWGGYRVMPDLIELWYGQRARLHERDRYELRDGVWTKRLLYP
jgi:pyridoxamine 5'-phosphate oxidase